MINGYAALDGFFCPCVRQPRERKQQVLLPSQSMVFLISARIVLYRHRKSGHHLGAKTAKIIVALSALICKKVSICKGFRSSILFDAKIQILFLEKIYCSRVTLDKFGHI